MRVVLLAISVFAISMADPGDFAQSEKYEKLKTYQIEVPGKDPTTVIEDEHGQKKRKEVIDHKEGKDNIELKNLMTHIVHDFDGSKPRCFGPSCQEGYVKDEAGFDDYELTTDQLTNYRDFPKDRLQAITALAAKLKRDKLKLDRFPQINTGDDDANSGKVYTSWNKLKVKQHKHPFDDKDGWVSLEPVAWSTSKISKWKPNVKKQKPSHWNYDEDKFPDDDRYDSENHGAENSYTYTQKRPILTRPGYINNKLHIPQQYDMEVPSKPTWSKPQQASYPSMWASDEGRRPHKPNCDSEEHYSNDDTVYYGVSDSLVTDNRPPNFPYEYEALHQPANSPKRRPSSRPGQVIYAGSSDFDNDRVSRPPHGDGQWVLLSTTKGYRNKKRQRSMHPVADDTVDASTVTSHQAVGLTVLPVDNGHTNMTTSHGGLLEVEKSFQTVEESKRDLDKRNDLEESTSQMQPMKNKIITRKLVSNISPDSSAVLAAVGAGMLPATMAMVVPMMLGRRRRRRDLRTPEDLNIYLDMNRVHI